MAKKEELTTMNLMETSIPQNFVNRLTTMNILVDNQHIQEVFAVTFTAIGGYLRGAKSKDTPAVFEISNLNGEPILQARVNWDDASQSWNYETKFGVLAQEGDKVVKFNDTTTHPFFASAWGSLFRKMVNQTEWLLSLTIVAVECLRDWLKDNAGDEKKTITADGIFTATTELQDEVVTLGIELTGDYLGMIKSDESDDQAA